jgi:uncharacterized protein YacL
MQPMTTLDISFIVFPSILIGTVLGYSIGTMVSLRMIDRVAISLIACSISGVIISFLLSYIVQITASEVLLSAISVMGGIILGLVYNWTPPPKASRTSHIIYEPYDDEDFERELNESMRGSQ